MKIVRIGKKFALMILIHYRIGKATYERWDIKASGTEEYCKHIYELLYKSNV